MRLRVVFKKQDKCIRFIIELLRSDTKHLDSFGKSSTTTSSNTVSFPSPFSTFVRLGLPHTPLQVVHQRLLTGRRPDASQPHSASATASDHPVPSPARGLRSNANFLKGHLPRQTPQTEALPSALLLFPGASAGPCAVPSSPRPAASPRHPPAVCHPSAPREAELGTSLQSSAGNNTRGTWGEQEGQEERGRVRQTQSTGWRLTAEPTHPRRGQPSGSQENGCRAGLCRQPAGQPVPGT